MRVTGGEFRGRPIGVPKGTAIRTTLDHVRQAIFNLIGARVSGARVLDLFSGSGALGIEALSRGAAHVTFVDRSHFSIQAIQANLDSFSLTTQDPRLTTILRADFMTAIRRLARELQAPFDVVLLDPPYSRGLARISLNALTQYAIVGAAGLVVAEADKRDSLPLQIEGKDSCLRLKSSRRYGDTALTVYERQ